MRWIKTLLCFLCVLTVLKARAQRQDLAFHLTNQLLSGKSILKVKRDFADPYLWVLAKNNEVYRINSITLVIDNYTAAFATYSTLPFIDIAGSNQNMVFVGTNTNNVIEDNNGVFSTLGAAQGLADPVNSIGISNFGDGLGGGVLSIGTTKGLGNYDTNTGNFTYVTYYNEFDIKIFEATYRSFILKSNGYVYYNPTLYPIEFFGYTEGLSTGITPVAESGTNVTTAFYSLQSVTAVGGSYGSDIFWGNEKGLFQETALNAIGNLSYGHYLNNINVNKVTNIYGLAGFGNPVDNMNPYSLAKENLLVGTDNGLYFSSSIYGSYDINALRTFSLFHFDDLGNIKVNDLCVNGTATIYVNTPLGCEDGVWVACDNGLYLLRSDYGKYFDPTQKLQAISFDVPFTGNPPTQMQICEGDQVKILLAGSDVNNNTIQWQKDGQDIVGATGTSITVTTAGDYNAILYSSCENIHVETNHLTLQVISSPVFSFNYPAVSQYCGVTSTVLQTDNNPIYKYRWYTNGVLNGVTTYNYNVTQSGKYKVEVSGCTDSWVPSKEVEVDLINLPVPQLTSSKNTYCQGDIAVIDANTPVDPSYTINWYLDGNLIAADNNLPTINATSGGTYTASLLSTVKTDCIQASSPFTITFISAPVFSFNYADKLQYCGISSTTLETDNNPIYQYRWYTNGVLNGITTYNYTVTQSGKYKVEVSACTNSWVPSKEIEVDLINLPAPTVTADKAKYCAGDNAVLTVNVPTDPGYTINWYKDGNIISTDQDKTSITATDNGNYSVTLSSTIGNCTQPSNSRQVAFTPAPVFTFNYPDKLAYCDGTPVMLVAQGSGSYQYRWYTNRVLNGDVTPTAIITRSGKYKVEVSACDGSWVPSKEVQVDIINIPVPLIKTDKPTYCIGDNATLSAGVSADPGYTINWYKDNVLLAANANRTSLVVNENGSYSVTLTSTEVNTDGTTCTQTAGAQNIVFNPPPTVSIQQIVQTTLCDGQTVDLKVSYNTGTVKWSTGAAGDQISVSKSGSYTATVTSAAGCTSNADINVQFFPNPILDLPHAGVCIPSHKTATLTAPAGMASYTWNGQAGTNTFTVDHPQTVTLTATDANGCTATQDVQVEDDCPNISIPNAFTPNGDGVNDTWNIAGLEYDPTSEVRIFTRNGQQIFESKGYPKPWDGIYNGKQLPTGVYYYVITAKKNTQRYSGSVTIIY